MVGWAHLDMELGLEQRREGERIMFQFANAISVKNIFTYETHLSFSLITLMSLATRHFPENIPKFNHRIKSNRLLNNKSCAERSERKRREKSLLSPPGHLQHNNRLKESYTNTILHTLHLLLFFLYNKSWKSTIKIFITENESLKRQKLTEGVNQHGI